MMGAMRFLQRLFHAWASARTRSELHSLSDHMLRDIGLDRRRIDALFR